MIRYATIKDLDTLCDISALHQSLMPNTEYHDKVKGWLKAHIENASLCYVYERNDKILGFILAEKLIANGLMIWTVAVLPEYANKGIAIKLHGQIERAGLAQKKEWIILYATNASEKICRRLGYKTNNNQYIEMTKFLDSVNPN